MAFLINPQKNKIKSAKFYQMCKKILKNQYIQKKTWQ